MRKIPCLLLLFLVFAASAQPSYPTPVEGDYTISHFHFECGDSLPELRIHYTTIGHPVKDANGRTTNAVLIMHGTTGAGNQFLSKTFGEELFRPGQLLDANKYFIILPDGIGHGRSSKPSDGMHMHFPKYDYDDMVRAQYLLITQHL